MLGKHSAVASGLETHWFDIDWQADRDQEFSERMELLRRFYDIDEETMDELVRASHSTADFLNKFLGYYTASVNKRRWAEKTPGNILHIEEIVQAWPNAKIIHIKRDPRDVYASLKQARKWDTVPEFVGRWCRMLGGVEEAKRRLDLDSKRFLEIRYESLVRQPKAAMKTVIHFVDEEWEAAVAEFEGKEDDFHTVRELTGKASTTLERLQQPLSNQRIGIWKQLVDDEELHEIRRSVDRCGLFAVFDKMIAEAEER